MLFFKLIAWSQLRWWYFNYRNCFWTCFWVQWVYFLISYIDFKIQDQALSLSLAVSYWLNWQRVRVITPVTEKLLFLPGGWGERGVVILKFNTEDPRVTGRAYMPVCVYSANISRVFIPHEAPFGRPEASISSLGAHSCLEVRWGIWAPCRAWWTPFERLADMEKWVERDTRTARKLQT